MLREVWKVSEEAVNDRYYVPQSDGCEHYYHHQISGSMWGAMGGDQIAWVLFSVVELHVSHFWTKRANDLWFLEGNLQQKAE